MLLVNGYYHASFITVFLSFLLKLHIRLAMKCAAQINLANNPAQAPLFLLKDGAKSKKYVFPGDVLCCRGALSRYSTVSAPNGLKGNVEFSEVKR